MSVISQKTSSVGVRARETGQMEEADEPELSINLQEDLTRKEQSFSFCKEKIGPHEGLLRQGTPVTIRG